MLNVKGLLSGHMDKIMSLGVKNTFSKCTQVTVHVGMMIAPGKSNPCYVCTDHCSLSMRLDL